jgi:hypothetical protein
MVTGERTHPGVTVTSLELVSAFPEPSWTRLVRMSHRRLSVSILEEGGRLDLKCLLLSYFRVGDHPTGTLKTDRGEGGTRLGLISATEHHAVTDRRTLAD